MKGHPRQRQPGGFTLMELLTVVAIIGILMSVALLGMQGMGRKVRFEGAAKTLRDKVMLARSRSIATGRKMAVRIQQTPLKKWKLVIVDSSDNIFDNDDDREYDRAYLFPKGVELEGEQEIEFSAEGGITYATSNPIVLTDVSERNEPWRLTLTIYKASGIVRIGELEKVAPEAASEEKKAESEEPSKG
ncbi:MAG: prepilin-type N-terminal cleavage/methylation domain-containing protein [bacterium]|nr:prepilin-type N-terminal cleavage/methylation domain-containing protein [bacterium]